MNLKAVTCAMQAAGIRRLAVISGEARWCQETAIAWCQTLEGDMLWLSDNAPDVGTHCPTAAFRTLLGREFHHAVFDARYGFHAEALAALAGTLTAGSWLLLLVPEWTRWAQQPDADSLRWADVSEPIATPNFVHHLQYLIENDEQVLLHQPPQPLRLPNWTPRPAWHCQAAFQQQAILRELACFSAGVAVITAARGRGKSALAGMLARQNTRCLITAPAKITTTVLASFAGDHYRFMAPDAILALPTLPDVDWLIVDEAAAIPAPLLHALVARFPRVLLVTTIQGYEGSGRGFMLKFCAEIEQVRHFTLDEPLRWARHDPLEHWLNQALLFEDAPETAGTGELSPRRVEGSDIAAQQAAYQLLTRAHYRTSPLDLRRLLDAPGMHLWLAGDVPALQGALWLVEEGGLTNELAQAVWAGHRRPRGNLVAQSLAAHAGFTDAATLRALRISRIAVAASSRRQGTGKQLVASASADSAGYDYLSVSFGYTDDLWAFWQACGFTLARIGSQREASSGCYAAMALRGLTPAGKQLQQKASQQLARDWPLLRSHIQLDLPLPEACDQDFTPHDAWLAAGFAWAQRPLEASLAVLQRLVDISQQPLPLLRQAVSANISLAELAQAARINGRKALIMALRAEAAGALLALPDRDGEALRRQLQ
ncbi:tRNA(Met) cytidine acetyltransferase TmcA [Pantoea allii]|uniref:tRNA(Met) cytidine acetyltransferase TmcA n=1 Tax=Pantoea allii TaxID=574096 RepID=UPI000A23F791|nr:GNAT family N-acetyltransferase [Pantoea allii]MBW1253815.1 GNAT family N-acetyltransferase [Pantoea allii]MBW1262938.1 GNAT family N-acetyltransferase [Pantoea allii]MBW1285495.1 GNAT family N-acetyltransferase [Pantoea allii]ORM86221.1 tRNA cytosine(34) acetyltransferase TmcA [Pantoea allii]PBJ97904.1 tRNA cytosine(34) acetyltransferase TmcA [Pantoea allii]